MLLILPLILLSILGGVLNADTFNLNTANTFVNTGGVLDADTFALSVAGDFDYVADFLGNGTITTNADNLHIGADFSYDDSANDFVLGINDTLTVLGSANIVAADFANSGTIAVTGSLGITAAGFDNSSIIRASSNFNATVATFINRAGATITAAECNFVHDSVTDEGTITCLNILTVNLKATELITLQPLQLIPLGLGYNHFSIGQTLTTTSTISSKQ